MLKTLEQTLASGGFSDVAHSMQRAGKVTAVDVGATSVQVGEDVENYGKIKELL